MPQMPFRKCWMITTVDRRSGAPSRNVVYPGDMAEHRLEKGRGSLTHGRGAGRAHTFCALAGVERVDDDRALRVARRQRLDVLQAGVRIALPPDVGHYLSPD